MSGFKPFELCRHYNAEADASGERFVVHLNAYDQCHVYDRQGVGPLTGALTEEAAKEIVNDVRAYVSGKTDDEITAALRVIFPKYAK